MSKLLNQYKSPLHQAAAEGNIKEVDNLLKKGKNQNLEEKAGENKQTPLHVAAYEGQFEMCYHLLSVGADVNAKDGQGWTPLHCAANKLHLKICILLLTRGADPNAVNAQQSIPLHYIIRGPYSEELIEVVNLMIERGVNLESKNKYEETPLDTAANKGNTESVRFLIDHKADVNTKNKFGQTLLHKAVENGNPQTVLLLLKNYCDPTVVAKDTGTALDIAKKENKAEIVGLLEAKFDDIMEKSTYEAFQGTKGNENLFVREAAKFQEQNEQDFSKTHDLEKSHWYFGDITRPDSENTLESCGKNSFLVRTCSVPGCFALSQFDANEKFSHLLIVPQSTGGFKLSDCEDTQTYASIEELVGKSPVVKGYQPAGALKGQHLDTKKTEHSHSTLEDRICIPAPGFRLEAGKIGANTNRSVLITPYNYKNWFFHSEHFNFIGRMNRSRSTDKFEPVVISVLPEPKDYRIDIWSRLGDFQVFFPIKDPAKAAKIKWKNGLPPEIKAFVQEKILEKRPKDKKVEVEVEFVKNDQGLREKLLEFEAYDPLRPKCFNVGVLYAKDGQIKEEENFGNEHGSAAFNEFLVFLGDKIPLKGWRGYKGDLDLRGDSTGPISLYRRWKGFEMMFHVSTMLPFSHHEAQQLGRKRRIGNDIGVIVFQEGGTYHPPIRSQFLHVYYVVSPYSPPDKPGAKYYRLEVCSADGVPEYPPEIPSPAIFEKNLDFRDFLLTKVLNGLLSSLNHPALRERIWVKPKDAFLNNLVKEFCKDKKILHGLEIADTF